MYEELKAAGTALTSLKSAFDLSKAFLDVKGAVDVQGKVFELQRVILSAQQDAMTAQQAQATLLDRISELEKQIVAFSEWNAEKTKYELNEIDTGAFAYTLKAEAADAEPNHWLCATCYQSNKKSILQYAGRTPNKSYAIYHCSTCKSQIQTYYNRTPSSQAADARKAKFGAGERCPRCGQDEFRVERAEPHPLMGPAGGRLHHMKCANCGLEDERSV